jgi:hypothetical protein
MKKTLTAAALSSVFVLGLASSALAIHTTDTADQPVVAAGPSVITLDGDIRIRGAYDKNDPTKDASGNSYYDERVQLGVKAKVSDEATGYVRLESGAGNNDSYTWGVDDNQLANNGLFNGGDKAGDLNILEAWINYQPTDCGKPGPWGVKAGHMPLALGNKMFFDHTRSGDDAIVVYGNLGEATHVAALTIKFSEGDTNQGSDDLDGYVALVTSKINDSLNLGGNYTYLRGRDSIADATNGNVDFGNGSGLDYLSGFALSNVGLTADGKSGPFDYMADAEFQFGTVQDSTDNNSGNIDAKGWAAKVAGNYDLGAGKVGLLFGYGSGNKSDSTDQKAYINFLSNTSYDTIIAGYRSAIPGAGDAHAGFQPKYTGLSNLTLYQLNASTKTVCPVTGKDLSLFASASYMQLSEDSLNISNRNGKEVGNVGTELDLIATWQLTAGLNYKVEAAYLFAGDAYESSTVDGKYDDLMFLRNSLELKF